MSNYEVRVPSEESDLYTAISGIIASGTSNDDYMSVIIETGNYPGNSSYDLISGNLFIYGVESNTSFGELSFNSSGSISIVNTSGNYLNVSGYGYLNISNTILISGVYSGLVSYFGENNYYITSLENKNSDKHEEINLYGSGLINYNLEDINDIIIISGNVSHSSSGSYKLSNISNLYISHCYGYNLENNLLTITGSSGFIINHCTFSNPISGNTTIDLIHSSGDINYSIITGNNGNNNSSISLSGSYLESFKSCIYDLEGDNVYPDISGNYINKDPQFLNPSGDLRLNIFSPCVANADVIDTFSNTNDLDLTNVNLTSNAVKFYLLNQDIKATKPSPSGGMFLLEDKENEDSVKGIFFKADTSLDNDMDITVNLQYKLNGTKETIQSIDHLNGEPIYSEDYKLIPYLDKETNTKKYYIEPYTILSFDEYIFENATISDFAVSGYFKNVGYTKDNYITYDGQIIYWVGEEYNNYIYGFNTITNEKVFTFPLFNLPSGVTTAKLPNIEYISRNDNGAYINTNKIYDLDHFKSDTIFIDNYDGLFKFKSFYKDNNMKIKSLNILGDLVIVLGQSNFNDSFISHNLYFYNKYEDEKFITSTTILSGVVGLDNINPTDMTFNDLGELYIGVSGHINKYKLFYDYALKTIDIPNQSTTLSFRENYNEVNV